MGRSPKGVITRSVPDWNFSNLYYGSATTLALAASDSPVWFGLFNSASAGQSLVVWHIEISMLYRASNLAFPATVVAAWNYNYSHQGSGSVNNGSLSSPGGLANGTVFSGAHGDAGGSPSELGFWNVCADATTGSYIWPHDWPYIIIPPNYSVVWFVNQVTTPQQQAGAINFYTVYESVTSPL
jgi:hypothetical protein